MNSKMSKKIVQTKAKKDLLWTSAHDSLYNMLYNKFSKANPADYESFITDNSNPKTRNGLLKFILNTSYSKGSQKNILFMVGRWLEINKDPNYKAYLQAGSDLRNQIEEDERNNTQSVKESEFYRPHDYFVHLIAQYNEDDAYKSMSFKQHIRFLILCLTVLQPPVRTSYYYTAKFISQKAQDQGEDNYIFLNKKTKTISYIINNDKVTKSKYYNMRPELKYIEVTDSFLKELIFYSFTKYPRVYLIEKSIDTGVNEPITQPTLLTYLRSITEIPGIDIDIMRSSYITWFYKHIANGNARLKLSQQMRHSVFSATNYYNKIIEPEPVLDEEAQKEIILENNILKDKLASATENKINLKAYTKKRYDILYRLNRADITKTRQSTIDKYNLEYNTKDNMWF